MKKFIIDNATLKKYKGKDEVVRIPDNVCVIAEKAFKNYVETVIIPPSVEIIEPKAFYNVKFIFILDNPFINKELQENYLINKDTVFADKIEYSNFNVTIFTNVFCPTMYNKLIDDDIKKNNCTSGTKIIWGTDFSDGLFKVDLPKKYKKELNVRGLSAEDFDQKEKNKDYTKHVLLLLRDGFPLCFSGSYINKNEIDHIKIEIKKNSIWEKCALIFRYIIFFPLFIIFLPVFISANLRYLPTPRKFIIYKNNENTSDSTLEFVLIERRDYKNILKIFNDNNITTSFVKVKNSKKQKNSNNANAYEKFVYDRTFNTVEKQKERAEFILKSNDDFEQKLRNLSYNPFSKRDIVKYVIENGIFLENVFYPERLLDKQGNDFRDFIESDNNFYFGGIKKILGQIDFNTIKNHNTKIFVEKCYRAVQMWNNLNDLYCALPTEDSDIDEFENFYELAINHIIACGEYCFKDSDTSKNNYIEEQNEYLINTLCKALTPYQIKKLKKYCKKQKNIQIRREQ